VALPVISPAADRSAEQVVGAVDLRHPRGIPCLAIRVVPPREHPEGGLHDDVVGVRDDLKDPIGVEIGRQDSSPKWKPMVSLTA